MSDPTEPDPSQARIDADSRRVAGSAGRWRRRSRRVLLLRRVLPIGIAVVAGGAVLWIVGQTIVAGIEQRASRVDEIRLSNPMFHGQDAQGRAFVIGAEEAVRDSRTGLYRLEAPLMRIDQTGGKSTQLSAGRGVYDEKSRRLTLSGQVLIADDGAGFRFTAPKAVVDTSTGRVTGTEGIRGEGPLGTISASSYAISEQGGRIVLGGPVRGSTRARPAGDTDG